MLLPSFIWLGSHFFVWWLSHSVTLERNKLSSLKIDDQGLTKYRVTVKTGLLVKLMYFMGRPEVSDYFKAVNTATGLV